MFGEIFVWLKQASNCLSVLSRSGASTPCSRPDITSLEGTGLDRPDRQAGRQARDTGKHGKEESGEQALAGQPGSRDTAGAGVAGKTGWNSRGGLAGLANDSTKSSPWADPRSHKPCSATLPAAKLEGSCFALGTRPCQAVRLSAICVA